MGDNPKRLKDLRVADLKQELEKRGLQISGIKAVLADRLKAALEDKGFDPEEYDFNSENTTNEIEDEGHEEQEVKEKSNIEENVDAKDDGFKDTNETMDNYEKDQSDSSDAFQSKENFEKDENDFIEEVQGQDEGINPKGDEEEKDVTKTEEKEPDEDSLNIMVGDEDNLFEEEERVNGAPNSPPRPENAPVKHPFTSNDTITLHSRVEKPPSENSSMRVNPDESQSVASHDSGDGIVTEGDKNDTEKTNVNDKDELSNIRNLWISGLSSNTKAADLKSVFSAYGKVSGAKIMTNSRAAGARCFGYVSMSNAEEADTCIQKLNRSELGGRLIVVEKATGETRPTHDSNHRSSTTRAASSRHEDLKRDDGDRNYIITPSLSGHDKRRSSSHTRRPNDSHVRVGRSNDLKDNRRDDRRVESSRHDRRDDRRHNAPILTLNQIKDQRNREQQREEDRRRRERERRRQDEEERRRKDALRRQQEAEDKLRQEREELKRERERLEREKKEIMELERERQRAERRKLERDKADLEKLKRQSVATHRLDDRRATKRLADESDPYMGDRKRDRMSGRDEFSSQSSHGSFQRRTDERNSTGSRYERSARDINIGQSRGALSDSRHFSSHRSEPSTSRDFQPPRGFSSSTSSGQRDGGSRNVDSRDYRSRDSSRMAGSMSSASNTMTVRDRDGGRMGGRDAGSNRTVDREVAHRETGGRVDRRDGGDIRHDRGSDSRMDVMGHTHANYRGGTNSGRSSSSQMQSHGGANSRSAGGHHHMSGGRSDQHISGSGSSWSNKGGSGGYAGSSSSSGGMSDYGRGTGNSGILSTAGASGGHRGGGMPLATGMTMPFQTLAAQLPMMAALGQGGGIVPMNDNRYDGYSSNNKSMMNHQQRRGY